MPLLPGWLAGHAEPAASHRQRAVVEAGDARAVPADDESGLARVCVDRDAGAATHIQDAGAAWCQAGAAQEHTRAFGCGQGHHGLVAQRGHAGAAQVANAQVGRDRTVAAKTPADQEIAVVDQQATLSGAANGENGGLDRGLVADGQFAHAARAAADADAGVAAGHAEQRARAAERGHAAARGGGVGQAADVEGGVACETRRTDGIADHPQCTAATDVEHAIAFAADVHHRIQRFASTAAGQHRGRLQPHFRAGAADVERTGGGDIAADTYAPSVGTGAAAFDDDAPAAADRDLAVATVTADLHRRQR